MSFHYEKFGLFQRIYFEGSLKIIAIVYNLPLIYFDGH